MRNKFKLIMSLLAAGLLLAANTSLGATNPLQGIVSSADEVKAGTPVKFDCKSGSTASRGCSLVENDTLSHKLDDAKKKNREDKINEIDKLYQAQISRAQDQLNRLENILVRVEALRGKLTSTDTQSLSSLDALITQAQSQKAAAETALAALKSNTTTVSTSLSVVQSDTSDSIDTSLTNVTNLKHAVQQFQVSVKDLKKQLIAFHQTLTQIVKQIKIINRATIPPAAGSGNTGNNTSTNTSSSTDSSAGNGGEQ